MRLGLEPTTPPAAATEARRIRRLVLVVLSLAGGVMGALVIGRMAGPEETASLIAFGTTTALLTCAALWLAMRRTSSAALVGLRIVGFSILAGVVNAPAAYLAGALASSWQQLAEDPYQLLLVGAVPIVLVIGFPWSFSYGLLFGLILATPAAVIEDISEVPKLVTRAHARIVLGLFLTALPMAVALATHITPFNFDGYGPTHHSSEMRPAEFGAAIGFPLIGLTLFALGLFRLATQRLWLRRIRSGELPGWALVPATGAELADAQLLPFSDAHREGTLIVVRETPDVAGDPYRSQSPRVAWARVAADA
jgi:hypothetical protein